MEEHIQEKLPKKPNSWMFFTLTLLFLLILAVILLVQNYQKTKPVTVVSPQATNRPLITPTLRPDQLLIDPIKEVKASEIEWLPTFKKIPSLAIMNVFDEYLPYQVTKCQKYSEKWGQSLCMDKQITTDYLEPKATYYEVGKVKKGSVNEDTVYAILIKNLSYASPTLGSYEDETMHKNILLLVIKSKTTRYAGNYTPGQPTSSKTNMFTITRDYRENNSNPLVDNAGHNANIDGTNDNGIEANYSGVPDGKITESEINNYLGYYGNVMFGRYSIDPKNYVKEHLSVLGE